jgi:hypothetical protein
MFREEKTSNENPATWKKRAGAFLELEIWEGNARRKEEERMVKLRRKDAIPMEHFEMELLGRCGERGFSEF